MDDLFHLLAWFGFGTFLCFETMPHYAALSGLEARTDCPPLVPASQLLGLQLCTTQLQVGSYGSKRKNKCHASRNSFSKELNSQPGLNRDARNSVVHACLPSSHTYVQSSARRREGTMLWQRDRWDRGWLMWHDLWEITSSRAFKGSQAIRTLSFITNSLGTMNSLG